MKAPILETATCTLRPSTDTDVQLWQVWDTDPDVQAHMPEPPNEPQTIEAHRNYIKECGAEADGYYWSIETKDGVTIGTIALTDINDHHHIANLGIVIGDKSYWGKGLATEVVQAVVAHAFANLAIERINAEAEADNVGIQKALKKAGFEQDGAFKSARVKQGSRIDVLHFGVVKESA